MSDLTTIALGSIKGGCGKTTMTVCLAEALARQGQNVLVIDYDGQANLTSWVLGRELQPDEVSILDVLTGDWTLAESADEAEGFGFDFVGSTDRMFRLEVEMAQDQFRVEALRREMKTLSGESLSGSENGYDFCLIDCPPALGLPVMQSLLASDWLLVPTLLEKMSAEGLKKFMEAMQQARDRGRAEVELLGVIPNIVHEVRNMTERVARPLRRRFEDRFWEDLQVPVRTRISEASARSMSLKAHCEQKGSDEHVYFDRIAEKVISHTKPVTA